MSATRIGFAMTGSFCTFSAVFEQLQALADWGYELTPVLSYAASQTDNRFYAAEKVKEILTDITGRAPLTTLNQVEPIGPKKLLDVYVIAPLTGNSLGKLCHGVYDTPALLGAKAHLRNGRPVVAAISTNDGLAGAAENVGRLMNMKHFYLVPFGQDDPYHKPSSLVAHFDLLQSTIAAALAGAQLQPMLREYRPAVAERAQEMPC